VSLWDMPETHAQNQSRGGGFGARRVCLRRDARRNCSPYCRTIAAAGFSRIPTPPRSSTMRTRLQCAARHPPRSIALPSVATLTRSLKTHAIMGVKRISTASVRFSQRDTRDRYLACRHLMLKRYGDKALEQSATRADELAADGDHDGADTWRRITAAVVQLANTAPPGPLH